MSEISNDVNTDLIKHILSLLCDPKLPKEFELDPLLRDNPEFVKLCSIAMDIRQLTSALNKGDLQEFVKGKGYILSNLKGLQANLRHLTWQTQKIAEGDFSPKVDFLGDFSESFNAMTNRLKELTNDLIRLANFDFLTKLPNRMALTNFLGTVFDDAVENGKKFCVLIIDIDHFKKVNDTYGHNAGDKILRDLSQILSMQFRASDFLGRYGGEEFLVVLPNTDAATAQRRGQELLKFVENSTFMIDETTSIPLTISIGLSEFAPGDLNYDSIVKRSDDALYQAKGEGRNRLCVL